MTKIQISLKLPNEDKKEYAKPIEGGEGLNHLAWCLQKASQGLEEKKPFWVIQEIFIKSMEKCSETHKHYELMPGKYKELLNRLVDIQQGKINFTSMLLKGLAADGNILIEVQQSNN
ncbi:hypothetical protein [Legionella brunensis]|uniref:Uncharacterized protein n=1 Tax=Legionella brunensis TaxID=29422 RepID=A0A0W0SSA3_9GAMM|nr:hypothetical protein [Legionella brunensis]KTC86278.1 hypothetical protein Lbru_0772 [Legionella brunensis]